MTKMIDKERLQKVIQEAVGNVLTNSGVLEKPAVKQVVAAGKKLLKEAVIIMPRTFIMKGEVQSPTTKENHEKFQERHQKTTTT